MARVLKSKVFTRDARKARITDAELCRVFTKALAGQVTANLGGGVIKMRLNRNEHRSIILMKGGEFWIYEYLFAKKDRENIEDDELEAFRILAGGYAKLGLQQLAALTKSGDLVEIRCEDDDEQDDEDEDHDRSTRED